MLSIFLFFQALSKVPTNVQHFAELGVYKQMRKKLPNGEKDLFPHLPRQPFPLVREKTLLKITSTYFFSFFLGG